MKDNAGTVHYSVFPAGACRWLRPSGMLQEKPLHVELSTAPTRWQPRLTLATHTRPRPSSFNSVFEILTIIEFHAFPSFPFPFSPFPSPLSPLRCFQSKFAGGGRGWGWGLGGLHALTCGTHQDRVPWAIETQTLLRGSIGWRSTEQEAREGTDQGLGDDQDVEAKGGKL